MVGKQKIEGSGYRLDCSGRRGKGKFEVILINRNFRGVVGCRRQKLSKIIQRKMKKEIFIVMLMENKIGFYYCNEVKMRIQRSGQIQRSVMIEFVDEWIVEDREVKVEFQVFDLKKIELKFIGRQSYFLGKDYKFIF